MEVEYQGMEVKMILEVVRWMYWEVEKMRFLEQKEAKHLKEEDQE